MNAHESKAAMIAVWQTFASRDVAAIAARLHPAIVWDGPQGNATAVALKLDLPMVGPQVIAKFVATGFRELYRDAEIQITGIYGDEDRAIIEERTRATLPDGRPYDNGYCFVFEFEDGLVRHIREYMDTLSGWRQVFGDASVAVPT